MSDITRTIGAGQVRFSANTPAAATWMRSKYKSTRLIFSLPEDQKRAALFRKEAASRKFRVASRREQR